MVQTKYKNGLLDEPALTLTVEQPATDSADQALEKVGSEEEDASLSPAGYEILTYPADFTLEGLVNKIRKKEILMPGFQRQFVWTQAQASKLIESFLLGLPVPGVFFYVEKETGKFIVIDGQQRLKSICYFFSGIFGENSEHKKTVFQLVGLHEKSPWLGKTFEDLKETDEKIVNKLNNAVMRAFVVKQLEPNDTTSIFHIFERLNTGGTLLTGQEVRNCVYEGKFNDALKAWNGLSGWREVFGKQALDKRMRDVELILRFLALFYNIKNYEKPMKEFLNKFMAAHKKAAEAQLEPFREIFETTLETVRRLLGPRPFHVRNGLNVAVFDAVFVATAKNLPSIPKDFQARFGKLNKNKKFITYTTSATTDEEVIPKRIEIAERLLFARPK